MCPAPMFEITEEIAELNAHLESEEGITDADLERLLQLGTDFNIKAESVGKLVKIWRSSGEQRKAEGKRQTEAGKRDIEKADRLLKYVLNHMIALDIKEAGGPIAPLKRKKNPPFLMISGTAVIPGEFITIKTEEKLDKVGLKKAIQDGLKVEGVWLKQAERLDVG